MTTIGDSFAVVALLGGICLSAWSMIMSVVLVFPSRARFARERLTKRPWSAFIIGLVIWVTIGTLSIALLASSLPAMKLLGWIGILGLASIAAIGSAGLATLASERLRAMAPDQSHYASLSKSTAYIVIAGLLPVLGWFLIVPILVFCSTGAGVSALLGREQRLVDSPQFQP